jgi:hypothetical protein
MKNRFTKENFERSCSLLKTLNSAFSGSIFAKAKLSKGFCLFLAGALLILIISFVFSNEFSGISFELENNLIESSNELVGEISIDTSHNFATIRLIILHKNGSPVYKENIILESEKLIWNYDDLGNLPEGKYTAILRIVSYEKVLKDFEQKFEIRKEARGITGETINFVKTDGKTYGSIVALVISLAFLGYVIKKTKKKVGKKKSKIKNK